MVASISVSVFGIASVVLLASLAIVVSRLFKIKSELLESKSLVEQLRVSERLTQEGVASRLAERDEQCQKILAAKDQACEAALSEKTKTCDRLIADKEELLRRKDEDVKQALADRDAQHAKLLAEKNHEIERFLKEKENSFAETVKTLKEQFANLASEKLKAQSGDLSKANSEQLELTLKPLREQLDALKSATEKTQVEHAKLAESIDKDIGRISDVAKELSGVSEALKSNTRVQGRTGEDILAEKLRQSGLEEGISFFLQKGTQSDRPDAQVCDSQGRWLIIDSKVVLTNYFQYVESKDEKDQKVLLSAHVNKMREKIDQLIKKNYPKVFAEEHSDRNYLPVTAMFVAYEAPLQVALREDPTLWRYAIDHNVVLVTPLTLIAYLRLVYLAWQRQELSRNQEEIMDQAKELLKRMNAFLVAFESIKTSIDGMYNAYDEARKVIVDAPNAQTIAKAANKLIDLKVRLEGRKGSKVIKAKCLADAAIEEAVSQENAQ